MLVKRTANTAIAKAVFLSSVSLASQHAISDQDDQAYILEEIIVSATKREVSLQDIAQAVTVADADFVQSINATNLSDISSYVPSLDIQRFAPGQSRITIRGISPDEQTGVTAVSYYVDEIAITSPGQSNQADTSFYDIQQVEFLRGPQGTLFGEGAMGGTVRIISNRPQSDAFSMSARAKHGFIDDGESTTRVDAMINLPIIQDRLAMRIVGGYSDDQGWIDAHQADPLTGEDLGRTQQDANSSESSDIKAMIRWDANERLTIDGTYIYNKLDVDSINVANQEDFHVWFGSIPRDDEYDLYNLTISYGFDRFQLVSATSYTDREYSRTDPEVAALFGLGLSESAVLSTTVNDVFTQEIRLVSTGENKLDWIIGLYYRDGDLDFTNTRITEPNIPIPGGLFSQTGFTQFETKAIFGELNLHLTDNLSLLLGARWFEEEESVQASNSGLLNGGLVTSSEQQRKTDDYTTRLSLAYTLSDQLLSYASYSEGYRPGGFNSGVPNALSTYEPDTTKNYEIGTKYQSQDRRWTVNVAAFYIDWDDMQFIQLDPETNFLTFVGNGSKASSKGAELEIMFKPSSDSWISFGGNYTKAQTESDLLGNLTPVIPSGTELPGVPEYKLSAAGGLDIDITDKLILAMSGGVSYVDERYSKLEQGGSFTIPGLGAFEIGTKLDSYTMASLRAEVRARHWAAALYVDNITDEDAELADDNFGFLFGPNIYYSRPRTIGLELSYKM